MKIRYTTLILGLLILMFLADGANSILLNLGHDFYRISIFIRLPAEIFFLFLVSLPGRNNRIWWFVFWIFGVFVIGSLAAMGAYLNYQWLGNFSIINKMLMLFIAWEAFRQFFRTEAERRRLFRTYEWLVLIQAAVIILSFLFNWKIFAAYIDPSSGEIVKFGFQGLIPAQNEISGFFVIAFFFFLWQAAYFRRGWLQLIIIMTAGLFTGTKVCLALPVILAGYLAARWCASLIKGRISISFLILAGIAALLAVLAWIERDVIWERLAPTIAYYTYKTVGQLNNWNLIDVVSTGRTFKVKLFLDTYLPRFNVVNYLFGGHDLASFSVETDLFDVLARFGIIGGGVFFIFYISLLLKHANRLGWVQVTFIGLWLGVSMTAGHLIFSAINGCYLAILILLFTSPIITQSHILGGTVMQAQVAPMGMK